MGELTNMVAGILSHIATKEYDKWRGEREKQSAVTNFLAQAAMQSKDPIALQALEPSLKKAGWGKEELESAKTRTMALGLQADVIRMGQMVQEVSAKSEPGIKTEQGSWRLSPESELPEEKYATRGEEGPMKGTAPMTIRSPETPVYTTREERLAAETAGPRAKAEVARIRSKALVDMDDAYAAEVRLNPDMTEDDKLVAWGRVMDEFQKRTQSFPTEQELKAIRPAEIAGIYEATKQQKIKRFERATTLRKEYAKASEVFVDVRDAYARIQVSKIGTAAGDLALIFNFMKMLDPGSVVREGEFANAQNATGVPGRVRNLWNKLLTGVRLNEEQLKDFVGRAQDLYTTASTQQQQLVDEYTRLARDQKIKPEKVIVDYTYQEGNPTLPKGIEAGSTYAGKSKKTGKDLWRSPNGELQEVD